MLTRVQQRNRMEEIHRVQDLMLGDSMRNERNDVVLRLVPPGWKFIVHESSILIHPEGRVLPSVKVYDGRIFHEHGKRLAPKSDVYEYRNLQQLETYLELIFQYHKDKNA